jgi:hypothetical protein
VNSRFKMIAYSRERSWTNGLCWYLWVISWLRSHGVKSNIVFTVDNGEEFGGKSWMKVRDLRKLISGFGCRLIQNHKGHAEENAHLERSHLTDDQEFYIPRVLHIKSEAAPLGEATGYIYYYDNVREHSSLGYQTPFAHLKAQSPDTDDTIRLTVPFIIDDVSVQLGPWSGYHLLAQHQPLSSGIAVWYQRPTRRPIVALANVAVKSSRVSGRIPIPPQARWAEEKDRWDAPDESK